MSTTEWHGMQSQTGNWYTIAMVYWHCNVDQYRMLWSKHGVVLFNIVWRGVDIHTFDVGIVWLSPRYYMP